MELKIDRKKWEEFFIDVTNSDYKILHSYRYPLEVGPYGYKGEMLSFGIVLQFTYFQDRIMGRVIVGMKHESEISQKMREELRKKLGEFFTSFQSNKKDIFVNLGFFDQAGGCIFDFYFEDPKKKSKIDMSSFEYLLENLFEFFYNEIFHLEKTQILVKNPPDILSKDKEVLEDLENLIVPDWLKGSLPEHQKKSHTKVSTPELKKIFLRDMGGNNELKLEIGKIISFFKNKKHFDQWNIKPPKGMLFYGPPGTGKTMIAKIIANEIGLPFYTLEAANILSKYIGEGAKNLKKFFDQLPRPCIVFIDEIDVFVPSREKDDQGHYGDVMNTLLQYLDGSKEENDILFLAATNRIDSIDPALLRAGRFDYKIFVDYPDFEARKEIWNIYLQKAYMQTEFQFLGDGVDIESLAQSTNGFTGAEISEIIRRVLQDYALGSLASKKVQEIVNGKTTQRGLMYFIEKFKKEKIHNKALVPTYPEEKLSDIGGSFELKKQIRKLLDYQQKRSVYESLGIQLPKGILLYGPPGTGKTLAARVIANELGSIFYVLKGSDFGSKRVNESSEKLKQFFDSIQTPCVVFIDEIDGVFSKRESFVSQEDTKVLNLFLQYLDGFLKKESVLFLAATNRIEDIDPAMLRAGRFDVKILVDSPDAEARKEIFEICMNVPNSENMSGKIFDESIDTGILAEMTQGLVGADISEIIRRVKYQFIENNQYENKDGKIFIGASIKQKDIEKLIREYSSGKKKKVGFIVDDES